MLPARPSFASASRRSLQGVSTTGGRKGVLRAEGQCRACVKRTHPLASASCHALWGVPRKGGKAVGGVQPDSQDCQGSIG